MTGIKKYRSFLDFKRRCDLKDECFGNGYAYVYIVEYGTSVKIGCTSHIITRLCTHDANARIYAKTKLGRIAVSPLLPNAIIFENNLHYLFAQKRIGMRGECFDIPFDEAVEALSNQRLNLPDADEQMTFRFTNKHLNQRSYGETSRLRNTIKKLYGETE